MSGDVAYTSMWDESERLWSLLEAAAREAVLNGDGALCERKFALCPACGVHAQAVWFRSRGWTCEACEEDVPGIAPTPAQRRAGKAPREAIALLLRRGGLSCS